MSAKSAISAISPPCWKLVGFDCEPREQSARYGLAGWGHHGACFYHAPLLLGGILLA
jgi:hypothetical protein